MITINYKYLIGNMIKFVFLFFILLTFSLVTDLQLISTYRFGGLLGPSGPMCNVHLAHPIVEALKTLLICLYNALRNFVGIFSKYLPKENVMEIIFDK